MNKTIILLLCLFYVSGGCSLPGTVNKQHKSEKTVSGIHYTFGFNLENISGNNKKENIVKQLVYRNMEPDDYILFMENEFIDAENKRLWSDNYQYEYFPQSDYRENVSVNCVSRNFVIIEHRYEYYKSGAAHGYYNTQYHIIDCAEERILEVNDIINELPTDLLKDLIRAEYDEFDFEYAAVLSPPDAVTFNKKYMVLHWNLYSIAPYSFGEVKVNAEYKKIRACLTEKGKAIIKNVR
ncbi:MAG: RsiV family protein [Bacteroidales bacterium]|nr:RsiV family protein [Bacteroidales bacterium]